MSFANKENPVSTDFYVRLQTVNELQKKTVRKFYKTVNEKSPSGVTTIFEVTDPTGNPSQAFLVHRIDEEGNHIYEIPLTRNLTADEIYEIVEPLNYALTEGDFIFETSTMDNDCCPHEDDLMETFERDIYEEMAERLTMLSHNRWVEERVSQGWVLGEARNDQNKTHPLIKPWDLLSEEQKAIDYDLPKNMLDLLAEFNYTVISTDDLNVLLK